MEWLADDMGLPIELPTDFDYPGHAVPRVHSLPGRHGSALLGHLLDAVDRNERIDLLAPARLVGVEPAPDGRTAVLENPAGEREEITARAVLLATNGYGADRELVAAHLPDIADAHYHGGEHSRGDALRIGRELGAATGFLDAYQLSLIHI